jgi:hypothetical protein
MMVVTHEVQETLFSVFLCIPVRHCGQDFCKYKQKCQRDSEIGLFSIRPKILFDRNIRIAHAATTAVCYRHGHQCDTCTRYSDEAKPETNSASRSVGR